MDTEDAMDKLCDVEAAMALLRPCLPVELAPDAKRVHDALKNLRMKLWRLDGLEHFGRIACVCGSGEQDCACPACDPYCEVEK